jgi:hypothetical protein
VCNVVTPDLTNSVVVSGSVAYLADGKSGLQVIDISDPANPKRLGGADTPMPGCWSVAVSGSYVYVAGSYSGLHVLPGQCDPLSGVGGRNGLVSTKIIRILPNPSSHEALIRFQTQSAGVADVVVYDVAGRLVRGLHNGVLAAGRHDLFWDGRNDEGGAVGAGIYFVRVVTADGRWAAPCLRVR